MNRVSLADQLNAQANGLILDSDGSQSECFNFYDWFCKDSSLQRKAWTLMKQTKRFVKEYDINLLDHYVFFKNNCPMRGPLYDDFRICNRETGDVIFTVIPKCGHSGLAEIWGRENDFKGPIKTAETFSKLFS
jgi:hypothetical protein